LKEHGPTLTIDYSKLGLLQMKPRLIKALTKYLNDDEITHDLMVMDEESANIKICNPMFVAYIRWIYDK